MRAAYVVVNYAANGIQNGSPDGVALVDDNGVLVEFLSYEGVFAATNGPAAGITSIDIGVSEAGTEAAGTSLARNVERHLERVGHRDLRRLQRRRHTAADAGRRERHDRAGGVHARSSVPAPRSTPPRSTSAMQPIAGATFTWASTNPAVASVSATGVVTALAVGDTVIVATASNGVVRHRRRST